MTGVEYMCSPFARCGVNVQTTARSMLLRYNIVTERETADAMLRADAYLSTQPTQSENEKGQMRDIHADGAAKSLTVQREGLAPQVGFEPTTLRLTAGCSTLELLRTSSPRRARGKPTL